MTAVTTTSSAASRPRSRAGRGASASGSTRASVRRAPDTPSTEEHGGDDDDAPAMLRPHQTKKSVQDQLSRQQPTAEAADGGAHDERADDGGHDGQKSRSSWSGRSPPTPRQPSGPARAGCRTAVIAWTTLETDEDARLGRPVAPVEQVERRRWSTATSTAINGHQRRGRQAEEQHRDAGRRPDQAQRLPSTIVVRPRTPSSEVDDRPEREPAEPLPPVRARGLLGSARWPTACTLIGSIICRSGRTCTEICLRGSRRESSLRVARAASPETAGGGRLDALGARRRGTGTPRCAVA